MRDLLLFGKLPRRGQVKTRLVPPLSTDEALALYRAFLDDQLRFLRHFEPATQVAWWTDAEPEPADLLGLTIDGIDLRQQGPGDLGARMARAFDETRRDLPGATLIVGADCPTLPVRHVHEAFAALEAGAAAVISPAEDGGYVLIGMTEPRRELFDEVDWSTAQVASMTRRNALALGIELVGIDPWYDVDEIGALHRLEAELRGTDASSRAPATVRTLVDLNLPPVV
jgi:rSAM/selenodomain-associated transferase 1